MSTSHNNRREAHRHRTQAHGEIESDKDLSHRYRDYVIHRRPKQILHHFSVRGPRQLDRAHNVARVAARENTRQVRWNPFLLRDD